MRIRSLAALAVALSFGAIVALLPLPLQAGEVPADPAPPAGPAPLRRPLGPVAGPGGPDAEGAPAPAPLLTREQLRELVGPVALYPDVVLSSLLPASAAPLDVVQAARWLAQRASPDEAPPTDRGWDPSVVALLQFPELVLWLDENLEWLEQLGLAMAFQPGDVLAAIQEFREMARASGALATNEHQRVGTREMAPPPEAPAGTAPATIVYIEPVDPQVIYVPVYDPVVVIEPVVIYEPVVWYSASWSFSTWGPCAWHELSWGWPWRHGSWGGGIWVHRDPWHCGRPRPTHYVSDYYRPTRWRPSLASHTYASQYGSQTYASRAYAPRRHASGGIASRTGTAEATAPRTASDAIVRPRRPAWDVRSSQDGALARSRRTDGAPRAGLADRGATASRDEAKSWRRKGVDLPSHVTSAPRAFGRDGVASEPRVTRALPSIPPAMDRIGPSLPGVGRPTLGTSRPSPALGERVETPEGVRRVAPRVGGEASHYGPRSRPPVVVRPSTPSPAEEPLRIAPDDTPPAAVVLPPTSPRATPRSGRSSWRRAPEAEQTPEAPEVHVLPTPRSLPEPSRGRTSGRRALPAPVPDAAPAPESVPAPRRVETPGPRSSRHYAPRVERTERVEAPRAEASPAETSRASERARSSGNSERASRRGGQGGEDAPSPAHSRRR